MTMSVVEIEQLRVKAWAGRAKGRGVRWRMIRDTLATVAVYWMTSLEVEVCMIRIWGLTKKKTREILEEMVSIGEVQVEKDEASLELKYHIKQERVNFWFGTHGIQAIPAGIVQVVETTRAANASEA